MKRIILLGPPGAGKGTQADILCQNQQIPHISTGDILRGAIAHETALGKKAKTFMDKGHLVPDDLIIDLIHERLGEDDCENGFLLDGFPRTVEQAEALDTLLESMDAKLTNVIDIEVPDNVIIERIKSRAEEGSGRADDNEEVAAKRLKVYWEQTAPVSHYYESKGLLQKIDGLGTVEEVTQRINSVM